MTPTPRWDSLWLNVQLLTLAGETGYGRIDKGAIACRDGRIAWLGAEAELPGPPVELAAQVHDGRGYFLTPGLVDCHTHLVYGNRSITVLNGKYILM